MNKELDRLRELAALNAVGALDGAEARAFAKVQETNAFARSEAAAFNAVAEALALSSPRHTPSPGLKDRILQKVEQLKARPQIEATLQKLAPAVTEGFAFCKAAAETDWMPLPAEGAFCKLLSFDPANAYATVLGKLAPGARYPAHKHINGEDIFMISGDLQVGDQRLHAGDFHHAAAGTTHGVNWSEHGCVLLAVISKEDLLAQLAPA